MNLVVDTSILFSFFNQRSRAREISLSGELILYAPMFALNELEEHKDRILEDFSLNESQFEVISKLLKIVVQFVGEEEYSDRLSKAKEASPDPDDVDFFALALKFDSPIWSNDSILKRQSTVQILTTEELVGLLGL